MARVKEECGTTRRQTKPSLHEQDVLGDKCGREDKRREAEGTGGAEWGTDAIGPPNTLPPT